eukprot:TRINITY_DN24474_c0_g1_i1.p1 TRINITY_DN24474_c0_g1~~TRINITY_DN24474_c0_g1_i1.p1  ORF type:complete len:238 (+),score=50.57 TRINITY_DN24474_c0_g1_i1:193-906(+)
MGQKCCVQNKGVFEDDRVTIIDASEVQAVVDGKDVTVMLKGKELGAEDVAPVLFELVDDTCRQTAVASSCGAGPEADRCMNPDRTPPVPRPAAGAFGKEGWWSFSGEQTMPPHTLTFQLKVPCRVYQWSFTFPGVIHPLGALEDGAPLHIVLEARSSPEDAVWRRVDERRMWWPWDGAGVKCFDVHPPFTAWELRLNFLAVMGQRGAAISNFQLRGTYLGGQDEKATKALSWLPFTG